jgi:hypothetical protein
MLPICSPEKPGLRELADIADLTVARHASTRDSTVARGSTDVAPQREPALLALTSVDAGKSR